MAQSGTYLSLLALCFTLLVGFYGQGVRAEPPPLCRYCNGSQIRCRIGQQCCNYNKKNAQCVSNSLTCNADIPCSSTSVQCGYACNTLSVWCPEGQDCCNPCLGANICVNPGGTCDQGCPGCGGAGAQGVNSGTTNGGQGNDDDDDDDHHGH